jgi:uncharacterized protein YaaN involved in tellurite resistance
MLKPFMAEERSSSNASGMPPEAGGPRDNPPAKAEGSGLPAVSPQPPSFSDEQLQTTRTKAVELAEETLQRTGDRSVIRRFDQLGRKEQEELTHNMSFLQTRLHRVMDDVSGDKEKIPTDLLQLRERLDELNPHVAGRTQWYHRLLFFLPSPAKKALKRIARKYETVNQQINGILTSLREGKEQLMEDNSALETLLKKVDQCKREVECQAYLGELLIVEIEKRVPRAEQGPDRQRLQRLVSRLYTRVQDMRVMEQVNLQFDVSISQTMENNDQLIDSIDRTLNVARPLLAITLSLQVALQRQKRVARAKETIESAMGEMLQANAEQIRQQTREIGDLFAQPVLGLKKVQAAYNAVLDAMDIAERNRAQAIKTARKNIGELQSMSSNLQERVESFRAQNPMPEAGDETEGRTEP